MIKDITKGICKKISSAMISSIQRNHFRGLKKPETMAAVPCRCID